ncbi:MAG: hypothetical protein K0Q95_1585 [Bacteroidota bacterium]|jgi:hypothetical protein|nr:hypothetical protein [Bacteroidota bacterium]
MTNTTNLQKPTLIEKENISGLKFPEEDVLKSKDEMKIRAAGLEKALKLGNLEHGKIKIIFEDSEGLKQVDTTVWGVTDKRVILKKGAVVPIHRIHEVIV